MYVLPDPCRIQSSNPVYSLVKHSCVCLYLSWHPSAQIPERTSHAVPLRHIPHFREQEGPHWSSPHSVLQISSEPEHDKTNEMISAPSIDSGQPGCLPSLISLRWRLMGYVPKERKLLQSGSEDSDQTASLLEAQVILLVLSCSGNFTRNGDLTAACTGTFDLWGISVEERYNKINIF